MEKVTTRKLNKKMLERIIIIHNAIKSGSCPDNRKLQHIYCEQTGYESVGKATINRDIDTLRTYFQAPLNLTKDGGATVIPMQTGSWPLTTSPQMTCSTFLPQRHCSQASREVQCTTPSPRLLTS